MLLDAASLPDDVDLLKAMLVVAGTELEQLRMQVARLRRMAFGRSSERLTREADQLELGLEEAEVEAAARVPPRLSSPATSPSRIASRFPTTCRARTCCTSRLACVPTVAARCGAWART